MTKKKKNKNISKFKIKTTMPILDKKSSKLIRSTKILPSIALKNYKLNPINK